MEKLAKTNKETSLKNSNPADSPKTGSSESVEKPQPVSEKKEGPGSRIYKAMDEIKLDIRYYFLEDEFRDKIAAIYNKNEAHLERLGIEPKKYLDYARETFDRYKQLNKKMPLDPMNKKSWEYVEKSLKELIAKLLEKFVK
ncbi:LIC11177 family protein [Leptospira gomenensis]|uniref:LIC11177 family protein n=1 Tax=Leptospira gomenensis TaxID=2484974 RepID=UPI003CCC7F23